MLPCILSQSLIRENISHFFNNVDIFMLRSVCKDIQQVFSPSQIDFTQLSNEAGKYGTIEQCKLLLVNTSFVFTQMFISAVTHANLEVVRYFTEQYKNSSHSNSLLALARAIGDSNSIEIFSWYRNTYENMSPLHIDRTDILDTLCKSAIECENINAINWIHENYTSGYKCLWKFSLRSGNHELIKHVYNLMSDAPFTNEYFSDACIGGNECIIRQFLQQRYITAQPWHARNLFYHGMFDMVRPFIEQGKISNEVYNCKELFLTLRDVMWYVRHGIKFSRTFLFMCLRERAFDILQYLFSHNHTHHYDVLFTNNEDYLCNDVYKYLANTRDMQLVKFVCTYDTLAHKVWLAIYFIGWKEGFDYVTANRTSHMKLEIDYIVKSLIKYESIEWYKYVCPKHILTIDEVLYAIRYGYLVILQHLLDETISNSHILMNNLNKALQDIRYYKISHTSIKFLLRLHDIDETIIMQYAIYHDKYSLIQHCLDSEIYTWIQYEKLALNEDNRFDESKYTISYSRLAYFFIKKIAYFISFWCLIFYATYTILDLEFVTYARK